jgi:hypothetical protein
MYAARYPRWYKSPLARTLISLKTEYQAWPRPRQERSTSPRNSAGANGSSPAPHKRPRSWLFASSLYYPSRRPTRQGCSFHDHQLMGDFAEDVGGGKAEEVLFSSGPPHAFRRLRACHTGRYLSFGRLVSWAELARNGTERHAGCQSARQCAGRSEFNDWVNGKGLTRNGKEWHNQSAKPPLRPSAAQLGNERGNGETGTA